MSKQLTVDTDEFHRLLGMWLYAHCYIDVRCNVTSVDVKPTGIEIIFDQELEVESKPILGPTH
jgi:hypothetical protein